MRNYNCVRCGKDYVGHGGSKYCLDCKVDVMEARNKKNIENLKRGTAMSISEAQKRNELLKNNPYNAKTDVWLNLDKP